MTPTRIWLCPCFALLFLLVLTGCSKCGSGCVQDEALRAGRSASSFPAADDGYFHDMDQTANGIVHFAPEDIKGRNMWLVWTGGNDRLWDVLTVTSVGTFDLLKTLSSYPTLKAKRRNRWEYLGLVNEPCFKEPTGPDPNRYGCGSIPAIPPAAPTRSRMRKSIPE